MKFEFWIRKIAFFVAAHAWLYTLSGKIGAISYEFSISFYSISGL